MCATKTDEQKQAAIDTSLYEAAMKAKWEQRGKACGCGEPIPLVDALDNLGECGACFNLGTELSWTLQG